MDLAKKFKDLCESEHLPWEGYWSDLSFRYNEPHRRYHNLDHIDAVLTRIPELVRLLGEQGVAVDQNLVEFAAFYHDAVYIPNFQHNENLSADMALNHLSRMGYEYYKRFAVAKAIIDTRSHVVNLFANGMPDETRVLIDADLYGLATDYELNKHKVRAEVEFYAGELTDDQWREGRRKFLEAYLLRRPTFLIPGQNDLEVKARDNMRNELRELGGCPEDTNGDGDCGQRYCPFCGI